MIPVKAHDPVLLRVPAHLFKEVQQALYLAGYNLRDLRGGNNHYKVEAIPQYIRRQDER